MCLDVVEQTYRNVTENVTFVWMALLALFALANALDAHLRTVPWHQYLKHG